MKRDLHSIEQEPQYTQSVFTPNDKDPADAGVPPLPAAPADELEAVRESVNSEPQFAVAGAPDEFAAFLERNRARYSAAQAVPIVFITAVIAGFFAVGGAFFSQNPGYVGLFYAVVVGPVAEEFLKQMGLIYLLEKRPYLLTAAWQFPLIAAITAFVFATVENLLYIYGYYVAASHETRQALAMFRWPVCTALHVGCAIIASLGLMKVWRECTLRNKPADLSGANNHLAVAVIIHGIYNLIIIITGASLFR